MRDVRLLFAGLITSMVGDSLMLLVFAIWVKTLTGSNSAAAAVLLAAVAPCAVAPAWGRLVDRVRHRPFLVGANLASAVMLLPLFAVRGAGDFWIIYPVAACYGVSMVATTAALNGLLKELLAEESLGAANGTLQTVREGLRLGGPLAGAALFTWGGGQVVVLADMVSFLLAAATIALLRVREDPPDLVPPHWRREISEGLRHLLTDPMLRRVMLASVVAWLAIGFGEGVSFVIVGQTLHRPPAFVGVLSALQGAGSIAGGLVSVRLKERGTAFGLAVMGAGSVLCMLTPLPVILLGRAAMGFGFAVYLVAATTTLQVRTPQRLIGRASTAVETLTSGPQVVGMSVGTALIALVDYRVLLALMGTGTLVGAGLVVRPGRAWSRGRARGGSPAILRSGSRGRASAR